MFYVLPVSPVCRNLGFNGILRVSVLAVRDKVRCTPDVLQVRCRDSVQDRRVEDQPSVDHSRGRDLRVVGLRVDTQTSGSFCLSLSLSFPHLFSP